MKKLYISHDNDIGFFAKLYIDNNKYVYYVDNDNNKSFSLLIELINKLLKKGYLTIANSIIIKDINITFDRKIIFELYKDTIKLSVLPKKRKANRNISVACSIILSLSLVSTAYTHIAENLEDSKKYLYDDDPYVVEEIMPSVEIIEETPDIIEDDKVHTLYKRVEGNEEKYQDFDLCNEQYGEIIRRYAADYGIDPNIIIAIGAQNINSSNLNEVNYQGKIGIMGLNYNELINRKLRVYNFTTKEFELFTISDKTTKNKIDIKDPEANIRIICALLQIAYKDFGKNLMMALESIDCGYNNVVLKIEKYCKAHGMDPNLIYKDKVVFEWLTYSVNHDYERSYALNILSYIKEGTPINMCAYSFEESISKDGASGNKMVTILEKYKIDSYERYKIL